MLNQNAILLNGPLKKTNAIYVYIKINRIQTLNKYEKTCFDKFQTFELPVYYSRMDDHAKCECPIVEPHG